jgi:HK97 family phage major capsid protein
MSSYVFHGGALRVASNGTIERGGYKEVVQAQADVLHEQRAILDAAGTSTLSAGQRAEFETLGRQLAALKVARATVDAGLAAEKAEAAAMSGSGDGNADASARARALAEIPDRVTGGGAEDRLTRPTGSRFAQVFPRVPLEAGGFASADDFLGVLHSQRHDPRMRAATMSSGDDPHGGFAVPAQFSAQWLDTMIESEIVRPRATIWPMTSKTRIVPAWDTDGAADANGPYGVAAQWIDESDDVDMAQQQFSMRQQTLVAHSMGFYVEANNALVSDGLGFNEQLMTALRESGAFHMDRAFFKGSGTGQPAGILVSPARVVVAKETGQAADTIRYENCTKMLSRLRPSSFAKSIWVAHTSTIPQLMQLQVAVGTGGTLAPAVVQSNGQFTLLTRPLIFSEKVPTLGDEGDLGLYDFSAYMIGMRADVSIDLSQHVGFRRNKTAYRLIVRLDGMPSISTPYTQEDGTTVSPFVVLAARA